jgi:hypothetical protein
VGDHEGGTSPSLASGSLAEHRHVAGGRAWVCRFDLHGWSTPDMNVQVRTGDGLLARYRQHSGISYPAKINTRERAQRVAELSNRVLHVDER